MIISGFHTTTLYGIVAVLRRCIIERQRVLLTTQQRVSLLLGIVRIKCRRLHGRCTSLSTAADGAQVVDDILLLCQQRG